MEIKVGKLKAAFFKRGAYAYAGSAMGGLKDRLGYHLRQNKKPHWHIDYLTGRAVIREIIAIETDERLECKVVRALGRHFEPISGFGCSDCKCKSHLFLAENREQLKTKVSEILASYGRAGKMICL